MTEKSAVTQGFGECEVRGTKIKKINEEEVGGLGGFKEREKCESYWVRW